MSEAAYRHSHEVRRRCQSCESRKARFSYRGQVKADRDQPPSPEGLRRPSILCFACFRAERERRRAQVLADDRPGHVEQGRFDARQLEHRRRMLAHLASARRA